MTPSLDRSSGTTHPGRAARTRRVATVGCLMAVAFALSYLESLVVLPVPVPGVKLGLANIAVLFALFALDVRSALWVALGKVAIGGMLTGSFAGLACSAVGTAFAVGASIAVHRGAHAGGLISSMCAAIAHNAGQLLVMVCLTGVSALLYYGVVLFVAACVTGAITGLVLSGCLSALGPRFRGAPDPK